MIVETERRLGLDAIPEDIKLRMTALQRGALARFEGFGWFVKFVRRPLFQEQIIVLVDPSGVDHAILTEDGELDHNIDFDIR
jgi:hypothetical protein